MSVILGVNHQFLYPGAMTDAETHTRTLQKAAELRDVAALDCWMWPDPRRAEEERRVLRDSGKKINYNIGDRPMDEPCFPASPDASRRRRTLDIYLREIGYALNVGAKKIVLGSGPDVPEDRPGAKERFAEFLMRLGKELPEDVTLALEPTDRTIDKHFLFGPAAETAEFIREMRANGLPNLGMLLDMGHVPIMGETLSSAVQGAAETLVHVHLGNCVVKNPQSPFYGDKHVAWGAVDSEYGEKEAAEFLRLLNQAGYFQKEDCTVSFEMRPIEGLSPEESLRAFVGVWEKSMPGLPVSKE